jgi:peptidoglycan/LPS O-acetylase OafA/YrhL
MSSKPDSSKEFAGLEIARFLCALAVIFWHYQHFFVKGAYYSGVADGVKFPLGRIFWLLLRRWVYCRSGFLDDIRIYIFLEI